MASNMSEFRLTASLAAGFPSVTVYRHCTRHSLAWLGRAAASFPPSIRFLPRFFSRTSAISSLLQISSAVGLASHRFHIRPTASTKISVTESMASGSSSGGAFFLSAFPPFLPF